MGKGNNWETRAERANIKREEARARKAAAKNKVHVSVEGIITRLSRSEGWSTLDNQNIIIYIDDIHSITSSEACPQGLRTEACHNKRCKLLHDSTLAIYRNIKWDDSYCEIVHLPIIPIKLAEIDSKTMPIIKFIIVSNVCVYDWLNPEIWLDWYKENRAQKNVINSIPEGKEEVAEEREADPHETLAAQVAKTSLETLSHLNILPKNTIFRIISFLSVEDICHLESVNHHFRNMIRADDVCRMRKKEHVNLFSKENSKRQKEEKKKKAKNAYVKKTQKKDGFARGMS